MDTETKKLPTKEEIQADVRKRRAIQEDRTTSSDKPEASRNIRDTNRDVDTENRYTDNERPGTTQQSKGRDRLDEGNQGSRIGYDDTTGSSNRTFGRSDSSIDQRFDRTTTSNQQSEQPERQFIAQPIKKSKFDNFLHPYKQAIHESKTNKKKEKRQSVPKKPLTDQEAKSMHMKLVEVLLWQSEHADNLVIATTKGHDHSIIIWSDIDKEEAEVIATFLLKNAKRDPKLATVVRQAVDVKDDVQFYMIVLPRIYRTFMTYISKGFSIR